MRLSSIFTTLATALSVSSAPVSNESECSSNKTILLTNDDGWASTNIRAAYRELKSAGHEVILVAPVQQRSGYGGQFGLPTSKNLTAGGDFNYPPAGAPSWGHEDNDMNIWYFNGTPSSCVAFGLNYIIPEYFGNKTIDLVVGGPNEGTNLSPGLYTLSGTVGAIYSAVNRGIPGIAFSGSMTNNSFFQDDISYQNDTNFGANILAKKVVDLVDTLFESFQNRPNMIPVTTGINVNFPAVGEDCTDPEYVYTRMTGIDSEIPDLTFNETSGMPVWKYGLYEATTKCVFGDCDLPSESWLLAEEKCKSSLTLFSIDYDASYKQSQAVKSFLAPIFK
ncbi:sure-like protein [Metschnikowia bicuspidata var. bicuspidata NRRL YB-4993]|uniref:Sure-like protein n=1 Tax=Metschnikowia bicuspidata var. bicuspidata NRRL YB-4993 TaxID=869754 RepID=A0A1A0H7Z4_9ASCO|nr:sure-like protein [Metschnikowia bicuspidata var. bicuspidata NRRL YB-4993]OBA20105.1 sure-like protein [Metschnikowia bicuspidata var. bicuspidata NRRL YB-4993]